MRFPHVLLLAALGSVTLGLVSGAREAAATCMQSAELRPVLPDCRVPAEGRWPAELPVTLVAVCGACCAAGGPPVSCHYDKIGCGGYGASAEQVRIYRMNGQQYEPIETAFEQQKLRCGDTILPVLVASLPVGSYQFQVGLAQGLLTVVSQRAGELAGAPLFPPASPPPPPPPPPGSAASPAAETRGGCATCQSGARRGSAGGGAAIALAAAALLLGWLLVRAGSSRR